MATFVRLEIWTDVSCAASAARVAVLEPALDTGNGELATCVLRQSLTGVEQLTFSLSRRHTQAAEIVHGRVARVVWSDTTLDTEWRIAEITDQSGDGDQGEMTVTAQSILLDLARAIFADWDALGRPTTAFSALQLTSTEWITNYILPAAVEAGMPWWGCGTQDYTTEFDLDGEFVSGLEILRAIQQPGRAPGEAAARRNGSTSYLIDVLTARGSSATTVRVQTAKNLLAHQRTRRLGEIGTKLIPRASSDAAVRDMSQAYWRVKTIVSGTVAVLEDPAGGAGPIAFDDQMTGMYVAPIASTFSSQVITASVSATQRITVASTAGWTAGTTLLRCFRTATSAGERVISLAHPTRSLGPVSGGYGQVTRVLDVAGVLGDANIVGNPRMDTWSNSANPPDGWTKGSTGGVNPTNTTSRESTIIRLGTYSYKNIVSASLGAYTLPAGAGSARPNWGVAEVRSPVATPFTMSGLAHAAHAWVYIGARTYGGLQLLVTNEATGIGVALGAVCTTVGEWVKLELTGLDLSACTSGVTVSVVTKPDWIAGQPYWGTPYYTNLTFYVDSIGLGEADAAIGDVIYSGGTALWQRANVVLAAISDIVTGYSVQLADLARLDGSPWTDEPLTIGGTIEVVDSDLTVTTSQRVVDMEQDLLHPLIASVQLATPEILLTNALAGSSLVSGASISGSSGVVTTAPGTAAGAGVTDVYTKAEVDALLANYALLDGTRQFTGPVGINTGAEGFSIGRITYSSSGQADISVVDSGPGQHLRELATANFEVLWVIGKNGGTDAFADLVIVETYTGTINSVLQNSVYGSPGARTYSIATSQVNLAIAGAGTKTYTIRVAAINTHG